MHLEADSSILIELVPLSTEPCIESYLTILRVYSNNHCLCKTRHSGVVLLAVVLPCCRVRGGDPQHFFTVLSQNLLQPTTNTHYLNNNLLLLTKQ